MIMKPFGSETKNKLNFEAEFVLIVQQGIAVHSEYKFKHHIQDGQRNAS